MVPLIFQPYADDVARRVAARQPKAVLETAAGSGMVTRALAPLLPATIAYRQGTLVRHEIEAAGGDPASATDHVAAAIAEKHGAGPVSAKIQAHVIEAAG